MNREMNETTEFEYLDDEIYNCSTQDFSNYFPNSHHTMAQSVNLQNYEIIGQNHIDPKSLWLVAPIVGMVYDGQVAITGVYDVGDIDIVVIYQCSDGSDGSDGNNKKSIITSIKGKNTIYYISNRIIRRPRIYN